MWENLPDSRADAYLTTTYFEALYLIYARFSPPPSASSRTVPARLVVSIHLELRTRFSLRVLGIRLCTPSPHIVWIWLELLLITC